MLLFVSAPVRMGSAGAHARGRRRFAAALTGAGSAGPRLVRGRAAPWPSAFADFTVVDPLSPRGGTGRSCDRRRTNRRAGLRAVGPASAALPWRSAATRGRRRRRRPGQPPRPRPRRRRRPPPLISSPLALPPTGARRRPAPVPLRRQLTRGASEQALQQARRGHRRQRRERREIVAATLSSARKRRQSGQARRWARMSRRRVTRPSASDSALVTASQVHLTTLVHLAQAQPRLVEGLAGDRRRSAERGGDLRRSRARRARA